MLAELNDLVSMIVRAWNENAFILLSGVALLWSVHILNVLVGYRLCILGIHPRHPFGLLGVIFSPLLHGSMHHLFMNTIPGVILAALVVLGGRETLLGVTLCITLLGGLLVWLFGRQAIHIGASGIVMGYWGYLLVAAYQQHTLLSIFSGGLCFYYFSEMASNIVPQEASSSWEGHLFGLIAGIATALIIPSGSLLLI